MNIHITTIDYSETNIWAYDDQDQMTIIPAGDFFTWLSDMRRDVVYYHDSEDGQIRTVYGLMGYRFFFREGFRKLTSQSLKSLVSSYINSGVELEWQVADPLTFLAAVNPPPFSRLIGNRNGRNDDDIDDAINWRKLHGGL